MKVAHQEVRGVELEEREVVRLVLDTKAGLADVVPPQGDYLVLTDRRIIAAWREETRKRRAILRSPGVGRVEVTEVERDTRPLLMGGLFMIGGVVVPWMAVLLSLNGIIAWMLAAVLVALGAVTASGYFVREQLAFLTFQSDGTELTLPLKSQEAVRGAYTVVNSFFNAPDAGMEGLDTLERGRDGTPTARREVVRWRRDDEAERTAVPFSAQF